MFFALAIGAGLLAAQNQVTQLEREYGATNINTVVANGRLAAGLSDRGEVTTLHWPSPGLFDQLHYVTPSSGESDPDPHTLPRRGALPNMGLFLGLVFEQAGASQVEWLRDPGYQVEQSYLDDISSVVRTEFVSQARQITAVQELWLSPEKSVFALRIELSGSRSRLPQAVILFENLALCDQRIQGQPTADWQFDDPQSSDANDFALLYSARADALLHFRPTDAAGQAVTLLPVIAGIGATEEGHRRTEEIVDELTLDSVKGTFFAIGADHVSSGHQVGRVDVNDIARPQDAFFDAADGQLTGQPAVVGGVDGALRIDLTQQRTEITFYVAAGRTAGTALGLLEQARLRGFAALTEQVDWADAALDRAVATPDTDDTQVRRIAKRAIHAVLGMQSASSGAVVESAATQPPLALDCPATSALVDEALDVAARYDEVDRHQKFLRSAQRSVEDRGPAGTFFGCYYSDGIWGGGAAFALDATALWLWSAVRHYEHLQAIPSAERAKKYLKSSASAIVAAADAVAGCIDDATDLQCASHERNSAEETRGLWGAVSAVIGLRAAARALTALKRESDRVRLYKQRADEIEIAVFDHLLDEDGMLVGSPAARALALYPGQLLETGMAWRDQEIDRLLLEVELDMSLSSVEAVDLGLRLWSLSEEIGKGHAQRERLQPLVTGLFAAAEGSSQQFGLALVPWDEDGDGVVDGLENRVATPHMAAGALAYLTATSFYGRRPPKDKIGPFEDCFCTAAPGSQTAPGADWRAALPGILAPLFWAAVVLLRRRHHGAPK